MNYIQPKNWGDFQHYRDRAPTWIKLHKSILDNYEYQCLPLASRALAPMLWLLASEYDDGKIPADLNKIAFRLRIYATELEDALSHLISSGFFICYQDASEPLAECLPRVREREYKAEKEKEKTKAPVSAKRSAIGIDAWLETLGDSEAVPASDPIFDYADKAGIPIGFLELSWKRFCEDMRDRGARKKDWRAHYRNAVKANWFKLWWFDSHGECKLTTTGEQSRRAAA
jgi:hypothetical protein